jgi:hypothetical protein
MATQQPVLRWMIMMMPPNEERCQSETLRAERSSMHAGPERKYAHAHYTVTAHFCLQTFASYCSPVVQVTWTGIA